MLHGKKKVLFVTSVILLGTVLTASLHHRQTSKKDSLYHTSKKDSLYHTSKKDSFYQTRKNESSLAQLQGSHISVKNVAAMHGARLQAPSTAKSSWKKISQSGKASPKPLALPQHVIRGIRTFVFFVGFARSGHSIVGSILDAHPHIIMSHELNVLDKFPAIIANHSDKNATTLFNLIYQKSVQDTQFGDRNENKMKKGYSLAINSLWQGRYDRYVNVIGDKSGGHSVGEYVQDRSTFSTLYSQLQEVVGVPIKILHVVRNPYDIISSSAVYATGKKERELKNIPSAKFVVKLKNDVMKNATDARLNDSTLLLIKIRVHFRRLKAVSEMINFLGKENVLVIHHRDLVHNPKATIMTVTKFLGVDAPEEYLRVCADKVYTAVSRSRDLVIWPPSMIEVVKQRMNAYKLLKGYSYVSD